MRELLTRAGFTDIQITVKEDAADIIKDWMPGSGAEKFITSAYVNAKKPLDSWGFRDNVRCGVATDLSSILGTPEIKADASEDCCPEATTISKEKDDLVGC